MIKWLNAFASLYDKVSTLHPSDRVVNIQMSRGWRQRAADRLDALIAPDTEANIGRSKNPYWRNHVGEQVHFRAGVMYPLDDIAYAEGGTEAYREALDIPDAMPALRAATKRNRALEAPHALTDSHARALETAIRAEGYDILTDTESGEIKLRKAFDASPDA